MTITTKLGFIEKMDFFIIVVYLYVLNCCKGDSKYPSYKSTKQSNIYIFIQYFEKPHKTTNPRADALVIIIQNIKAEPCLSLSLPLT